MIGSIPEDKSNHVSSYQPGNQGIIDLTSKIKKDYQEGINILQTPWVELNDRTIIEDQNNGELIFNAYVDISSEDANDSWEWRGTRSKGRNKALSMHAQLTANFLIPSFIAQNDDDEEDRQFSEAMRDCVEWLIQPNNSDYQPAFLQVVMSLITDPVVYLGAEFYDIMQVIKERTKSGKYMKKEIIDEVLSGFRAPVFGCTEILRPNAYERNIQKQRSIIQRNFTEYEELATKYGDHENWKYVKKGIKSVYSDEDGLFYDIKDDEHPQLVAEEIWKHRRLDLEVPMINGIYMGDPDVNDNPIRHRDNKNAPKYNVIPFGYYPIGKHFAFYKSLMNALAWDNQLTDAAYETFMNKNFLDANMPIVFSGTDQVDSSVVFPKAVVSLENPDAKATPLLPPRNDRGLLEGLKLAEDSMSEGSVNETVSGQLPEASQKAYTVAQAQSNAKTLLKGVGRSLALSVAQFGDLMKDIIINHITIPQISELSGEELVMKYKTLTLDNEESGMTKVIHFDKGLIGKKMSKKQIEEENLKELEKLTKKTGKDIDKLDISLRRINPVIFANFKYLSKIDVEEMFNKGPEYWQPIMLELDSRMANNPYADRKEITREIFKQFFRSKGEKFMAKQPPPDAEMAGASQGRGSSLGNQVQQKQLSNITEQVI